MSPNLTITFKIEGTSDEEGHVSLTDFLTQLDLLQQTLKRFDALADETGRPRVYYRIVDASHSSPLTMVLEPVGKRLNGAFPSSERIRRGHDRYFLELYRIQKGEAPSNDVDDRTLEILQQLATPKSEKIAAQKIFNSGRDVKLDVAFGRHLAKLLKVATYSEGTLTGKLDALNIHDDSRTFWIYPVVGPNRIKCKFLPGEDGKAQALIGKYITVQGTKFFRANSLYPHFMNCRDFWESPKRIGTYDDISMRRDEAILENDKSPTKIDYEW